MELFMELSSARRRQLRSWRLKLLRQLSPLIST
jgi:hypothetical protein